MTEMVTSPGWTDEQRIMFQYQMAAVQKDELLGVLLAIFLGSFGAHHFYLRRTGLGILYLVFFWSGIPGLVGIVEAFFMPGRVREYNAAQAAYLSSVIGAAAASAPVTTAVQCPACGTTAAAGAKYCANCGAALKMPALPAAR